jgi:class 3 adenylate cyclase
MEAPETRYAKAGDTYIGYQVVGEGPIDIVFFPNWFSNIELVWEFPLTERWFRRLASFARVILFDQRGCGVSDPVPIRDMILLEERARDVIAVLDAIDSERAVLFACTLTGSLACYVAATHADRVASLVLLDASWRPEHRPEEIENLRRFIDELPERWGTTGFGSDYRIDPVAREFFARYRRLSMGPGAAQALMQAAEALDVTDVLPAIQAPTLVLHHETSQHIAPREDGIELAAAIPEAKFVALGEGGSWAGDDQMQVLDEVEEFLTGIRRGGTADRLLATVLFTDVVGSTDRVVRFGDEAWTQVVGQHEAIVRGQVQRFEGRVVSVQGEESLSIFDGPGRAIRCARAIGEALGPLDINVRSGLHTGEIELLPGGGVAGIAIHIGARICSLAGPGEVVVSRTVTDLVAGSGLAFEDRGEHDLKGVPGRWRAYTVVGG